MTGQVRQKKPQKKKPLQEPQPTNRNLGRKRRRRRNLVLKRRRNRNLVLKRKRRRNQVLEKNSAPQQRVPIKQPPP
jgi:hypothetical protein